MGLLDTVKKVWPKPKPAPDTATPSRTRKEETLQRQLDAMVKQGRKRLDAAQEMNHDAIRYVYGDQHSGKKRKKGWEYPVINTAYADMTQEVAILGAHPTKFATPPREDTDIEVAKICGQVLQGVWDDELNMRVKVIQGLYDDHLYGIKVAKIFWEDKVDWDPVKAEKTGDGWTGKICVNIIKPDFFGCDPDVELAGEVATKARYIWTERWVDKRWAALRWPKYQKHLKETGQWDKVDDIEGAVATGARADDETHFNRTTYAWAGRENRQDSDEDLQQRLANIILGESQAAGGGKGQAANQDLVKVQEFYFRDYTLDKSVPAITQPWPMGQGEAVHIFQKDDGSPFYYDQTKPIQNDQDVIVDYEPFTGDWPQQELRPSYQPPKYPNGRFVIRLADEVIVEDDAWPYKHWPFAVGSYYLLPHLWFSHNCVELSRGYQDWMNTVASHMTNYIKFHADPQLWVEDTALVRDRAKKVTAIPNYPGSVLRFTKGGIQRAKRMDPPQLSPQLFNIFELFKRQDQDLKGVHDIAHGRSAGGEQTLGELIKLDRNTRQRLALQANLMEVWLRQIALSVVELMQNHFEVGEWVRRAGSEPDTVHAAIQWTSRMASANYDVFLEPISALPYDDERETNKYLKAYELVGPAMLEDVLKKMKIANIKEIMAKHEIIGPLTQLLQMAMQMGMGPPELLQAIQAQLSMLNQLAGPQAPMEKPPGGAPDKPNFNSNWAAPEEEQNYQMPQTAEA